MPGERQRGFEDEKFVRAASEELQFMKVYKSLKAYRFQIQRGSLKTILHVD